MLPADAEGVETHVALHTFSKVSALAYYTKSLYKGLLGISLYKGLLGILYRDGAGHVVWALEEGDAVYTLALQAAGLVQLHGGACGTAWHIPSQGKLCKALKNTFYSLTEYILHGAWHIQRLARDPSIPSARAATPGLL
jgi:hypothetical protein